MAPSLPLVSIITPSFNQAQFLEETILSVINQDYPNIEYIVIDGGSTDGSIDIIRRYEYRLAYWASEPDAGQADAINKGWRRSSGELITWLCSDDTLLPGAIRTAVDYFMLHPETMMVYGDVVFIDAQSKLVQPMPAQEFDAATMLRHCNNYIGQQGSLLRRKSLEIIGFLDNELSYCFDFEYFVRLGLVGKIAYVPEALGAFRLHPASKSMSHHSDRARSYINFYESFFYRTDLPPALHSIRNEALSSGYLQAAQGLLLATRGGEARKYILKAIRLYPKHFNRMIGYWLLKSFITVKWLRRMKYVRDMVIPNRISAESVFARDYEE